MKHAALSVLFVAVVISSTITEGPAPGTTDSANPSRPAASGSTTPILGTQTSNAQSVYPTLVQPTALVYGMAILGLIWLTLFVRWIVSAGRWLVGKRRKRHLEQRKSYRC